MARWIEKAPILSGPVKNDLQWGSGEVILLFESIAFGGNKPGVPQFSQVLRNSRL